MTDTSATGNFAKALRAHRRGDMPTARALMRCWLMELHSEGEIVTDQEKLDLARIRVKVCIEALEAEEQPGAVVLVKTELRRMRGIQSALKGER